METTETVTIQEGSDSPKTTEKTILYLNLHMINANVPNFSIVRRTVESSNSKSYCIYANKKSVVEIDSCDTDQEAVCQGLTKIREILEQVHNARIVLAEYLGILV